MASLGRTLAHLGRLQMTLPLRPLLSSATSTAITYPSPSQNKRSVSSQYSSAMAGRAFSTTPAAQKRISGKLNPNKAKQMDQKIYILRRYRSKRLPAPLRMGRNRYLRHWTIHRAWQLYQRQERERHRDELMRMQQGISAALEELRKTSGPGTRSEGYLYRIAIKKARVWGIKAIPIEYARMQVQTPPKSAWNHDWKPEKHKRY